jgi:uncharacterized protein
VKLQPDRIEGVNAIVACTADSVTVHDQTRLTPWQRSVIVPWRGEVAAWPRTRFEELQAADFEALLAWQPELVVLGCGRGTRFVHPSLTRALIGARVGVECMDTQAACRTYNVLVAEGRKAVAALLLG